MSWKLWIFFFFFKLKESLELKKLQSDGLFKDVVRGVENYKGSEEKRWICWAISEGFWSHDIDLNIASV